MVFIPYLWSRINWKAELGLLGILHGQPLHKKGSKSWACSSTEGVKYDKALESRAHVDSPSDLVHAQVYLLPTDGVMTSGIIVGSILHAGYQLLRMEELPISSCPDFIWKYCVTFYSKFKELTKEFVKICLHLPMTVGSRSTKIALGTCLPELVSEKKVLNESSPAPNVSSDGIWPSGWIPCSRLRWKYWKGLGLSCQCSPILNVIIRRPLVSLHLNMICYS